MCKGLFKNGVDIKIFFLIYFKCKFLKIWYIMKDCFKLSDFINPDDEEYSVKKKHYGLEFFVDKQIKILDWNNAEKDTKYAKKALNIRLELNGKEYLLYTGSRLIVKELNNIRKLFESGDKEFHPFTCVIRKHDNSYKLED